MSKPCVVGVTMQLIVQLFAQLSSSRMEEKLSAMGLAASLDYQSEDEYTTDGQLCEDHTVGH